jgi:hypothetical protein
MNKPQRVALLGFLLMLSVCSAVVVHAANVLQSYANVEEAEINLNSATVSLLLSAEERETAINLVLTQPQIQELLQTADNYTAEASEIFDIRESNGDITLVPKEGLALVTVELNTDYGAEFGVQAVKATVDLTQETVTDLEVNPEVRRPKAIDSPLSPSELVEKAAEYEGVVVMVTGKVSLLGEVFGSLFMLDNTVTVFYSHAEATVDVSGIANGDTVTVTGKFAAPDTIYALTIEKN